MEKLEPKRYENVPKEYETPREYRETPKGQISQDETPEEALERILACFTKDWDS